MSALRVRFGRLGLVLSLVMIASFAGGCAGKKKKSDGSTVPSAVDADRAVGDSDSGSAMGLRTVNFPYDSFVLTTSAKDTLANNIGVLKDKGNLNIQIEGHCDERGGIQYNIALGEKRANAVRNYLIDRGVSGKRVTTISFGKERPLDSSSSESAWAKNRRANFVVTSK